MVYRNRYIGFGSSFPNVGINKKFQKLQIMLHGSFIVSNQQFFLFTRLMLHYFHFPVANVFLLNPFLLFYLSTIFQQFEILSMFCIINSVMVKAIFMRVFHLTALFQEFFRFAFNLLLHFLQRLSRLFFFAHKNKRNQHKF